MLFGHRPAFGYKRIEGEGYFKCAGIDRDGMNVHHLILDCNCERCGKTYQVGRVHVPQTYVDDQFRLDQLATLWDSQKTVNTFVMENPTGSFRDAIDSFFKKK